ncbi:GGDEF domain-containing protein [Hoeflea marina]|uniref:GGDEF domain-containing protein n=1 Tax=Hoeflea marina TaxID=274592 RepID=UPI001304841E|nr:GGDEF domain-containing protein [Hoeflea marina]
MYVFDTRQVSALRLSGAYVVAAVGFAQIMLVGGDLRMANHSIVQSCLFLSHFLLVWGVFTLYRRSFPWLLFGSAALVAMILIVYTNFDGSMFWLRVTTANAFMAFVYAICGLQAWRLRSHRVDAVIAAIFLVQVALTTGRVLQLYLPGAETMTPENFGSAYFAAAVQTSNALFAIGIGMALFARYCVAVLVRLNRLAETDPLTGLLNRRAFEAAAEALRVASAPLPTGLIICDIDHFKQVNDTHGHDAGDTALVAFAGLIQRVAGAKAVCTRLGGEEFCVLLADSSGEMTRLAATRLRVATETLRIATGGRPLQMTASFGYCELSPDADLRAAMAAVDAAVYQAKRDGRNLVRVAELKPAVGPGEMLVLDPTRATG